MRQRKEQNKQKSKKERNKLRLFTFKRKFLKISIQLYLQTALAAEIRPAEGQWLEKKMNAVKLRMFRAGTRIPTVSGRGGQHLAQLYTFIKIKHQSDDV
jgi:hypothetical protein